MTSSTNNGFDLMVKIANKFLKTKKVKKQPTCCGNEKSVQNTG